MDSNMQNPAKKIKIPFQLVVIANINIAKPNDSLINLSFVPIFIIFLLIFSFAYLCIVSRKTNPKIKEESIKKAKYPPPIGDNKKSIGDLLKKLIFSTGIVDNTFNDSANPKDSASPIAKEYFVSEVFPETCISYVPAGACNFSSGPIQ